jgi:hypothetical protein
VPYLGPQGGPVLLIAVLFETSNLSHRLFQYVGIMVAWSAILRGGCPRKAVCRIREPRTVRGGDLGRGGVPPGLALVVRARRAGALQDPGLLSATIRSGWGIWQDFAGAVPLQGWRRVRRDRAWAREDETRDLERVTAEAVGHR